MGLTKLFTILQYFTGIPGKEETLNHLYTWKPWTHWGNHFIFFFGHCYGLWSIWN